MKKVYIIAAIVGVMVAVAIYLFANSVINVQKKETKGVATVVAAVDIVEGTTITAEMLKMAEIPEKAILPGSHVKFQEVVGKIADTDIYIEEQVIDKKIATSGDQSYNKLSYKIKEGFRAVTLSVDDTAGVAGFIRGGDKVDILYTSQTGKLLTNGLIEMSTEMFLQDCEVLAVGTYAENNSETGAQTYKNVTLQLSLEDSMKLVNTFMACRINADGGSGNSETFKGGILNLALRNKDDKGTTKAVIVNVK